MSRADGGVLLGEVLARRGVQQLFTLCGGHISPILVGAKACGLQVIDVRDEASAVFAADAVARMTGIAGVAAVTAGPGVTNTVTAVKNAQLAQSPVILLGGAAATLLKGRGALQDIDQLSIMRPLTKWAVSLKTVGQIRPSLERAFEVAQTGVPGPVFIELPIDLLYPEALVRELFMKEAGVQNPKDLRSKALGLYVRGHLHRQFHQPESGLVPPKLDASVLRAPARRQLVRRTAALLRDAERPALVIGSQALAVQRAPEPIAHATRAIGIPTWLGGMARGLLGRDSDIQFRHQRGAALKEADLVIVAGFPFDFRLGYGRGIGSRATLVSANLSRRDLKKNRRPDLAVHMHPGEFLKALAAELGPRAQGARRDPWFERLRARESTRDEEIRAQARSEAELVNPLALFLRLEEAMSDDAIIVVDGGDFVATASYILRPRRPLSWLDPGVFGTLGVGGGFALGAAAARPGKEVWLIYGDGSCAFSLAEIDTCVRHGLAPIAIIGTDGSWAQIAREQLPMLGDDVGTVLRRTAYHEAAAGYGAKGLLLDDPAKIDETLAQAKKWAAAGSPVVINAHICATDFRRGSISI